MNGACSHISYNIQRTNTNKEEEEYFHCSELCANAAFGVYTCLSSCMCVYSYMCVHMQVLSVHAPVWEMASCCPTLLLPWWTQFGLQQVYRCCLSDQLHVLLLLNVCVCISACACLHWDHCASVQVWAFVCMHVHAQHVRMYFVHSMSVSMSFIGRMCPPQSCIETEVGGGCDDSERWWEEEVLVLF